MREKERHNTTQHFDLWNNVTQPRKREENDGKMRWNGINLFANCVKCEKNICVMYKSIKKKKSDGCILAISKLDYAARLKRQKIS